MSPDPTKHRGQGADVFAQPGGFGESGSFAEKKPILDDTENHRFTLLASSISIHWYE